MVLVVLVVLLYKPLTPSRHSLGGSQSQWLLPTTWPTSELL